MKLFLTILFCIFFISPIQADHRLYPQPYAPYFSQLGQDKYLHEHIFKNKTDGFFVDIGAHDGISYSNTYFFEKLGWTGICIEPIAERFNELVRNRNTFCIQACISDFNGTAEFLKVNGFMIEMLSGLKHAYDPNHLAQVKDAIVYNGGSSETIPVQVYTLKSILDFYQVKKIDLLSLDTEGGELTILKSILEDDAIDIDVIIVENHFNDPAIPTYMISKKYQLLVQLEQDLIFRKNRS